MLPTVSPSELVGLVNNSLELTLPVIEVEGEVTNLRISRGKWVYFDIADEVAKVKCFGSTFNMPGPLDDGMKVKVMVSPRLHDQYGFSLNLIALSFAGEGTIKKASELLKQKLEAEGLFNPDRKRPIPYPPGSIGLITSKESAAYKDFIKVLSARFAGIDIRLIDVQVQGALASGQVVQAVEWFNTQADMPEALVIIRGGGSADDLQAFSTEQVSRTVASSRIPTVVAIGHEIDVSLAELAADLHASTPSNAAELLVSSASEEMRKLQSSEVVLHRFTTEALKHTRSRLVDASSDLYRDVLDLVTLRQKDIEVKQKVLELTSPNSIMKRGYAIVQNKAGKAVKSSKVAKLERQLYIRMHDGAVGVTVGGEDKIIRED